MSNPEEGEEKKIKKSSSRRKLMVGEAEGEERKLKKSSSRRNVMDGTKGEENKLTKSTSRRKLVADAGEEENKLKKSTSRRKLVAEAGEEENKLKKSTSRRKLVAEAGEFEEKRLKKRTTSLRKLIDLEKDKEDGETSRTRRKSPSRRGSSRTRNKSPSRRGSSRTVGKSPSRRGSSRTVGRSPSRRGSSRTVGKSPSRRGSSRTVGKSPSRRGSSRTRIDNDESSPDKRPQVERKRSSRRLKVREDNDVASSDIEKKKRSKSLTSLRRHPKEEDKTGNNQASPEKRPQVERKRSSRRLKEDKGHQEKESNKAKERRHTSHSLGDSLLHMSTPSFPSFSPEDLQSVAEVSVATFKVMPESESKLIDPSRTRKQQSLEKPKKQSYSAKQLLDILEGPSSNTTTKDKFHQSTPNLFSTTLLSFDDVESVADVSVATFQPKQEDHGNMIDVKRGEQNKRKQERNPSIGFACSTQNVPESHKQRLNLETQLRAMCKEKTRELQALDLESVADLSIGTFQPKQEDVGSLINVKRGEQNKRKQERNPSIGFNCTPSYVPASHKEQLNLDAQLQAICKEKTKELQALDLESVADLSIGTFQPKQEEHFNMVDVNRGEQNKRKQERNPSIGFNPFGLPAASHTKHQQLNLETQLKAFCGAKTKQLQALDLESVADLSIGTFKPLAETGPRLNEIVTIKHGRKSLYY